MWSTQAFRTLHLHGKPGVWVQQRRCAVQVPSTMHFEQGCNVDY